jgi:glutamate--cysteine ligase
LDAPRLELPVVEPSDSSRLIRGNDDLLAPFHEAMKPREAFRVGAEAEKIGLRARTHAPLPLEGPVSVLAVLRALSQKFGWKLESEYAGGPKIALRRGDASITLEPAGQLELSGAPHRTIHQIGAEFQNHFDELAEVSEPLGISWISLGFHPFAKDAELPHVPKLRYAVMRDYLPTRGARGLDMMRRTCTVQANMDFSDEADAIRKLRVALAAQPIVTALFANSPLYEGRARGWLSERAHVWLNMDPDRSGLLPFVWSDDMSIQRYVDWALDVPMFMVKRGARAFDNTRQTFRTFLKRGARGERATLADWESHLNTLFPETRLKRTLEVRGADAQPSAANCALPALWKGLLYDDAALAGAEALISRLDPVMLEAVRPAIAWRGLRAKLDGREVSEWAGDLVALARGGLARIADTNEAGEDESIYLAPLDERVARGVTESERLIAQLRGAPYFADALVKATHV